MSELTHDPQQDYIVSLERTNEQQAQEIARLERERDVILATLFKFYDREEELEQQLAAMRTERDDAVDKREGAYMRLDELRQQLAASQAHPVIDETEGQQRGVVAIPLNPLARGFFSSRL